MTFLLIAAAVAAMILLYATDRILKALARVRRYHVMSERLDAVAVRSEVQQEQRKTAAAASTALTSVMPAINRPPLTLPSRPGHADRIAAATAALSGPPSLADEPGVDPSGLTGRSGQPPLGGTFPLCVSRRQAEAR